MWFGSWQTMSKCSSERGNKDLNTCELTMSKNPWRELECENPQLVQRQETDQLPGFSFSLSLYALFSITMATESSTSWPHAHTHLQMQECFIPHAYPSMYRALDISSSRHICSGKIFAFCIFSNIWTNNSLAAFWWSWSRVIVFSW